jgi:hypothetical protein
MLYFTGLPWDITLRIDVYNDGIRPTKLKLSDQGMPGRHGIRLTQSTLRVRNLKQDSGKVGYGLWQCVHMYTLRSFLTSTRTVC